VKKQPIVSVVIATYNYGRYLGRAIDSVLAQTMGDFELLVVDDGSTDDTPSVIDRYRFDPRLNYIRREHIGAPFVKNLGVRCARGEFVAFLDADDVWLPTKLERQLRLFEGRPDVGVVYSRMQFINEEGGMLPTAPRRLYRGDVLGPIFRDNFVCFSSSVVRKAVFERAGYFDTSLQLAIDYDLWLRIATWFAFDYVDETLVLYRTGHRNLSTRAEERLHLAAGVMRRYLQTGEGRERLGRSIVRRSWAETYQHLAEVALARSAHRCAAKYYVTSLLHRPWHLASWKGLGLTWLPDRWRRSAREIRDGAIGWLARPRATAESHRA
jgi:glycosyltransferase involved in cell wall biosynthesis